MRPLSFFVLAWRTLASCRCRSRSIWTVFVAGLALSLAACAAPLSYMGIPLTPGTADPELQALANRARGGNKQAQLDLGIAFEEGGVVERDLAMARRLYQLAASSSGSPVTVFVPGVDGATGGVMTVSGGSDRSGLGEAIARLASLSDVRRVSFAGSTAAVAYRSGDPGYAICRLIHAIASHAEGSDDIGIRQAVINNVAVESPLITILDWDLAAINELFFGAVPSERQIELEFQAFMIVPDTECASSPEALNELSSNFTRVEKPIENSDFFGAVPNDIFDVVPMIYTSDGVSIVVNIDRNNSRISDAFAVIWS